MKRLLEASIWGPHTIPIEEWPYRNLKRIMFPFIDILFFLSGFVAIQHGIAPLNNLFDEQVVYTFSLLLSFASLICLIGLSFPKLWVLELLGKSILIGLMAGYIMSTIFANIFTGENHVFDMFISAIAITPVIWRVSLLGAEWQSRRLKENKFGG